MRVLILKYEVLPEAYEFGIIGKFWIFAVGTAIQVRQSERSIH